MALKKAFWGVFQLELIKAIFSAKIGWNRSKLYWVSCIEVRHILVIAENWVPRSEMTLKHFVKMETFCT